MKTRKLNTKTGVEGLVLVGGLVAGFMASGAISAAVPADQRKMARIGMAGGGAVGAALLPSTDNVSGALKAISAGISARETYGLITDELKAKTTVDPNATAATKAYYGAIGLACACDQSMPLRAAADYPRIPVTTLDTSWNDDQGGYEVEQNDVNQFAA